MADNLQPADRISEEYADEEINLLDYWRVIWKWKLLIVLLVFITVVTTALVSLSRIDIYQAAAVITPAGGEQGGGSLSILSQQFGGLPGISLSPSTSTSEIVNLLKSNIIREKMINRYNLLPVLFYETWDAERQEWKRGTNSSFSLNPFRLISNIAQAVKPAKKALNLSNPGANNSNVKGSPTLWDGLRALKSIITVNNNVKDNTITVSAEFHDPDMAAKMVNYILSTLTDHMNSEARRGAISKRRYLEEQLRATADPLIRQKIYALISQQIETAMMSELKEDFAFKVMDPSRVPDTKIKPKRSTMVMLSLMTSLFAGVFLAFFLEYITRQRAKG